ncbi:MAG TPA: secondary thiamine-phosphate synthase enzyme YjbQ [Candidatus Nanoarchaeia archaeon]|nr:secondary thiamine-phosphate synthase enzyme YjbQ [Candidatus Nanoarchaeia archaeon]
MKILTEHISFDTRGNTDVIDITPKVDQKLVDSGFKDGSVLIFFSGATGALTTIEYEPGLVRDLSDALERLAPRGLEYEHNLRWGDGNGHSHIRASFLGPSLTVPFANSKLLLGTWQQIIFIDLDNRPRTRKLIVQITGEY